AADNTVRLRNALSAATNENRPLILPYCPPGTYIDIDSQVTSVADGTYISGYGSSTRIRKTNFPKGIFVLHGDYSYAGNFEVYGVPFDATGMGASHGENTGVMMLGSYSKVENIYGDVISTVVKSSPVEKADQVVGNKYLNIESGENVVFNFVIGNSKDCYFDQINGSYSDLSETPPHLIYADHFNHYNYNLRGGKCYAHDGKGSFAYQFKGCVGGGVDSLISERCEGNLHLSAADGFHIGEVISNGDTFSSLQGAGAMALDEGTKNMTIDLYKIDSIYESK